MRIGGSAAPTDLVAGILPTNPVCDGIFAHRRRGKRAYPRRDAGTDVANEHIGSTQENDMPRGDKSSYSNKQKRQAEHIEEGYKKKGLSSKTAESRAWATVNKESGGGKKSGSGRKKAAKKTAKKSGARRSAAKKGGRKTARKKSTARKSARTSSRSRK
jgi:hypothetical protein